MLRVQVLDHPRVDKRGGQTWTIDEEPTSALSLDDLIIFYTPTHESGIGRISAITDLRQHWVTFTIAGASPPTKLRIPVAWANLDDLAAFTYKNLFHSLPALPGPHRALRNIPGTNRNTPKQTETTENPEEDGLMMRVAKITFGSRNGRD